jgi:hypothetical protein
MPVRDARSPVQHHLVLHRIDPDQGVWRFYSLMIERDLFGRGVRLPAWCRTGPNVREMVEASASEIETDQAPEAMAQAERTSE